MRKKLERLNMTPFEFLIKVQNIQSDFSNLNVIIATNESVIYVSINKYVFICHKKIDSEKKIALIYQRLLNYIQNETK